MPYNHPRNNLSEIPEARWDSGLKEMNETWKGVIACFGVVVFLLMTIGIIYWQVVDQPNTNWILRSSTSGLTWDRKDHSLILQTLKEERTLLKIHMGSFPDVEIPFIKNMCWQNRSEFCYIWEAIVELKVFLDSDSSPNNECYNINWTPLHCQVKVKDCFSMINVSWYGGASVSRQHWPLNSMNIKSQPFTISNLSKSPNAFGSVLERYFLGSTGVTMMMVSDTPISLSVERNKHFCLENTPGTDMASLQYTVCVSQNITSAHQELGSRLLRQQPRLPDTDILRLPVWRYYGMADSFAQMERGLRSFYNKLQTHNLGEGIIALSEESTMVLRNLDHVYLPLLRRKRLHAPRFIMNYFRMKPLKLSITLSPYTSINSPIFQRSLQEGKEEFWLSHHSESSDYSVPLLTKWKGQFSACLNVTSQAAVLWYLGQVKLLKQQLGAKSSHLPLFFQMNPRQSDWSYAGLKGIIPSVLHYSLLGYNFFIPEAIGGTLSGEFLTDEELYIRWLQIVTFLPVMSFGIPPWVCCGDWVLNLTRYYIQRHQNFVVPLIEKYSKEWLLRGDPIFRPTWWLSPTEPAAFTIDDQFLIGEEVIVAPVTEQGQFQRDIYLPREGQKWMDTNTAQVFHGGSFLRNYSVPLMNVPVFIKIS
ncbi:SITS-binding protein-like isoform X3 [Crotalus tigris]|uniref:SITS-binding protein-like isoform X3 n=1 Tax=Crotalus tigris TaxID=88082 RepID=UPI00192F878A|nr:SITS-binding protein-like isoform X3 [Crotalus tigris]